LKQLGLTFPETYEQWMAQVPVIRAAGFYPVSMGNKDQWVVNSWLLSLLVDRLGGPEWFMQAAKGQSSFTEKPFVRSLEIIKEMTDKGMFSPGVNQMSNSEADQEFYQGKSVYLIDAGWRTSGMDKDLSATMQSGISMHVFPAIEGEVRHNTSTATVSEGFGINSALKGTEKADAAWKFIQYYTGAEGAAIRAMHGEVPTYKLDLTKVNLATMQAKFAQFQSNHDMGYVFDAVMGSEGVSMLNQDIQAMMLGNGDPNAIAAKYEAYVAKNDSNRI
jgi:raffinose/stachyose/melibiose transport system substrate-binding protein